MGRFGFAALGALSLAVAACGGGGHTAGTRPAHSKRTLPVAGPLTMHVSSTAFAGGSRIPAKYTCAGKDISPPLRWSHPPVSAKELALLMIDLNAPGGPFTHWALGDIGAATRELAAGQVPSGAVAGRNSFGKIGYGGPCPPAGSVHHYVIELLALARPLGVSRGFASGALARQRPIAVGVLQGTYSRS
jgi:Raf kinase inhibitor-like YbhB/YbcL family protein